MNESIVAGSGLVLGERFNERRPEHGAALRRFCTQNQNKINQKNKIGSSCTVPVPYRLVSLIKRKSVKLVL